MSHASLNDEAAIVVDYIQLVFSCALVADSGCWAFLVRPHYVQSAYISPYPLIEISVLHMAQRVGLADPVVYRVFVSILLPEDETEDGIVRCLNETSNSIFLS